MNATVESAASSSIQCLFLFIFLVISSFAVPSCRAKVPAVIVFGDSSVDSGNNNQIRTILKSNHKPYGRDFPGGQPTGRFSNGRIPPDFISEAMGIKPYVPAYLDPKFTIKDFATGVCFASAGTGYDNSTSNVLNVLPLWMEIVNYKEYQSRLRKYLGVKKANKILREALYLISIGTNDFLENYYLIPGGRSRQYPVAGQYEDFLAGIAENFLRELYSLGARNISLGGLPPMGCLPLERTTNTMEGNGCIGKYNDVAKEFNGKLQWLAIKLGMELPGIKLAFSNPYDPFLEIIRKPSAFGFVNAAVACCATGLFEMGYLCDQYNPFTCEDANKYVFWDSFHPSERTNQLLSENLLKTSLAPFL
ncbi:GDSL esterase/lipase At2g04570-like [Macadamia integrifolia]|uniref:GDSL esterase/lipase At2g04570-like n=1 Tax=Macadamia integrifolia TaxID=60698 RepID=UPI001C4E5886|nr:GDSL esterase/lipase At2g04570-like [Macadamia integrifolia]